ncbi:MAG: hypothetical protein JOZ54_13770 [Acidobacteria bacterium]|nr:hypothetical protein [Acidobacteriota bacterium]
MNYQVPMQEVSAVVALAGCEPEEHFVYLAPYSDLRDGPETMTDYLNGRRRRFFPMVAAGVAKMVNRDQILWLRYEKLAELDPDATLIERMTIVELTDGSRIEGTIPFDRPREQARVSDVLNDANEGFIRLDDEEETYFINKDFIRLVIPR